MSTKEALSFTVPPPLATAQSSGRVAHSGFVVLSGWMRRPKLVGTLTSAQGPLSLAMCMLEAERQLGRMPLYCTTYLLVDLLSEFQQKSYRSANQRIPVDRLCKKGKHHSKFDCIFCAGDLACRDIPVVSDIVFKKGDCLGDFGRLPVAARGHLV